MRIPALTIAALVWAGCSSRDATTLGSAVEGTFVPAASIQKTPLESPVVLQGTMTRKCPVAGCWFILQDETGTIKVDTKNAGFVVVEVPLNSRVIVAGRVSTNATGRFIDASGVRY